MYYILSIIFFIIHADGPCKLSQVVRILYTIIIYYILYYFTYQPENRLDNNGILDRIIVSLRQKQRQKHLFKITHNNIRAHSKDNPGLCQNYDVIRHYLETSYPKLTGNGDSSISLFKAARCCIKYNVRETLNKVINKAVVEHWTTKEIQRMIENIRNRYI